MKHAVVLLFEKKEDINLWCEREAGIREGITGDVWALRTSPSRLSVFLIQIAHNFKRCFGEEGRIIVRTAPSEGQELSY